MSSGFGPSAEALRLQPPRARTRDGADPSTFEGFAPRGRVLHVGLQTTPPVRPYPMPRLGRVLLLIGAIALWALGCGGRSLTAPPPPPPPAKPEPVVVAQITASSLQAKFRT